MKTIRFVCGLLSMLTLGVNAQRHPAFPSVDEAFNWIKTSSAFKPGSKLQTEYNVKDLTKATLKKIYYDNWDQEQPSYFYAYSSSRAGELFPFNTPYDRCEINFTITTPKDADGTYYDIPITAVYSRLKNDALTNTWEPYWFAYNAPYLRGGKGASSAEREALLMTALKKFKPDGSYQYSYILTPGNESDYASIEELNEAYTIDSVIYQKGRDYVASPSEQTWYYIIKAQKFYTDGGGRPVKVFTAWLETEAKARKGKSGWEIVYLFVRNGRSTDQEDYSGPYMGTFGLVGFDGVFQKKAETKPNAMLQFVAEDFLTGLFSWFSKLSYNKEQDIAKGKAFFDPDNNPEEAAWKFIERVYDAKAKMCDIKFGSRFPLYRDEKAPNARFYVTVDVERPNCNWSGYEGQKKKYKEAGMSAPVLKATGGHYQGGFSGEFQIAIKNGNWYVVSGSTTMEKPIPW